MPYKIDLLLYTVHAVRHSLSFDLQQKQLGSSSPEKNLSITFVAVDANPPVDIVLSGTQKANGFSLLKN